MRYKLTIALLCLAGLPCNADFKIAAPVNSVEKVAQTIESPATTGSRLPRLRNLPNGDVLMSWVEPKGDGHALKFGVLHDGQWVKQGEAAQGANWFVNWSDFPSVVAIDNHFWVAHWLAKQQGGKTYDYDVALAISNDAGKTWREIGRPHQDKGIAAEHGFATIFVDAGEAGIVWLDGRNHVKKEDKTKYPEKSGNFNLRYTRIHHDGSIEAEQVLDDNTCTCCWTSVTSTPNGAVAAWRGRTDDEIRDNQVALLRDGKWTKHKGLGAEGWKIAGCPVNGPTVVARGMQVAAAWFTAEGERPRVRVAFSKDGGETFAKPIDIDEASPLGRIGLVWKDDQTAVVSWMMGTDKISKNSHLSLRSIKNDGTLSAPKQVAELSAGRDTGVPQMAVTKRGLMLAWTEKSTNNGIKTSMLDWQGLEVSASIKQIVIAKNTLPFIPSICERH